MKFRYMFLTILLLVSFSLVSAQEAKIKIADKIKEAVKNLSEDELEKTLDQIISEKDQYSVDRTEVTRAANEFFRVGENDKGLKIYELNIKLFPDDWQVYNQLGGLYSWFEQYDKALKYLSKADELNPNNERILGTLSRVKGSIFDGENEKSPKFQFACGELTKINKPYFGETPPGLTPKLFAPGIISTKGNFEFSVTFTPDGKEMYFTRRADKVGQNMIMVSKLTDDGWTAPDTAKFSKEIPGNEPHITMDGKKLYFGTRRLKPGDEQPTYGIWMMERTGSDWSEPKFSVDGMYVSTTTDGSIYLTDISRGGPGGIVKLKNQNGKFAPMEKVTGGVNNPSDGIHPFVAPDESYIIFDCRRSDGYGGEGDLYVSYKDPNGNWSDAVNLGEKINGPGTDFCASVTPDGKYIFFNKQRDIYWVSSEIINKLNPFNK